MMNTEKRVPRYKGLQQIAEALRLEDYPMDKMTLNYSVGDMNIQSQDGEVFAIRDITDFMPEEEYPSVEAVIRSIHHVLDEKKSKSAA